MRRPPAEGRPQAGGLRACADVFVRRVLAAAVDEAAAQELWTELPGSARTPWLDLWLASDGCRLLGRFRAADASGAAALSDGAVAAPDPEADTIWLGHLHTLDRRLQANVLVEHAAPAAVFHARAAASLPMELHDVCLTTHRVRCVQVLIAPDGRRLLSFCRAPDAEAVRSAQRHGALPPGPAWTFRRILPHHGR